MTRLIKRRSVDLSQARFATPLPPLLQRIYCARQVTDDGGLRRELTALQSPALLYGLERAVALLAEAVCDGRRLLVVGDFDADGATSSALAVLALRAMGAAQVDFLVPNRFEYGYGLTPEIVDVAAGFQPDVLITVDNGISSLEGVAAANARGMQVIVTDHHLPGERLPDAAAIVNPNQPGCGFPSKHLAGVGVIFYVMGALRTRLRDVGWFAGRGIEPPNMAEFLDLVALGTVADVVPLDANNRVLVEQGLRRIRAGRARPGLLALLEVAGRRPERCSAQDLGFTVGPRLNAAGRMDDMSHGILCLLTDDALRAREWAEELDALNADRRQIEQGMQQEALAMLRQWESAASGDLPWGVCLYDAQWHQGVIGILASRVKDRLHRPVIAFADADGHTIKGSARSIPGFHIRDALDAVASRHPGLLSRFGGHAMAAGLSLPGAHFEAFSRAFDEEVRRQLDADALQAVLLTDGELAPGDLTLEVAELLRTGGPWGQQFPEPCFDGEFDLLQQRVVGERHLKMVVSPPGQRQQLLDGICFFVDRERWPAPGVTRVRLVYRLDINEFRGRRSVQLMVDHMEPL